MVRDTETPARESLAGFCGGCSVEVVADAQNTPEPLLAQYLRLLAFAANRAAKRLARSRLKQASDRARSALWHARNRAYREWVETNRELLEFLASSPGVPEHLRPVGSLPPRSLHELAERARPDVISRPDHLPVRPDAISRPDVNIGERAVRTLAVDKHQAHNRQEPIVVEVRPDVRTPRRGDVGGKSLSGTPENTPPKAPQDPTGRVDRVATVAELVARAGAQLVLTSADKRAIRNCAVEPAVIAEAFIAASRREWGGDFLHQNLSARLVIQRLSGYLAWKASRATNTQPGQQRRLTATPAQSPYEHNPWEGRRPPVDEAELERFYAQTGGEQ
jgi:hypothetical protein